MIHRDLLNQLLHPNTLQRLIDSEWYGNTYKISEFMPTLTDAIFAADLGKSVNGVRQNLQTEYIQRLAGMISQNSAVSSVSKAMAFSELNRVKRSLSKTNSPDAATKAHREYIAYLITKAVEVEE